MALSAERADPVTVIIESMEQDQRWLDSSTFADGTRATGSQTEVRAAVCEIPRPAILNGSGITQARFESCHRRLIGSFVTARKLGPLLGDQI
jgi:hypothetical protein